jgi:hypothetical protein
MYNGLMQQSNQASDILFFANAEMCWEQTSINEKTANDSEVSLAVPVQYSVC